MLYLLLALAGLVGGFLGGLIGVGGGIIFVLVLPLALQNMGVGPAYIPDYTVANSLFATMFSSLSANYAFSKKGKLAVRQILTIGLPGIVSTVLALRYIVTQTWYNLFAFNVIVCGLLAFMLFRMIFLSRGNTGHRSIDEIDPVKLGITGLISGVVAALSGLGGGIIMIPILNNLFKVDMKQASAVSLGVIGVTSLASTLYNLMEHEPVALPYSQGLLVFPLALTLAGGVLIGSPLGVKYSRRLTAQTIQRLFIVFVALNLAFKLGRLIAQYF